MISLEQAVDCFCQGFAYGRSISHPFEVAQVGPLRALRDLPRKSGDYRVEELVALDAEPDSVIETIRAYKPSKFFLSVVNRVGEDDKAIKETYKAHGFRLLRREPMFVKPLDRIDSFPGPLPIRRITDEANSAALDKAAGRGQSHAEDVRDGDARQRMYACFDNDEVIGWVKSVRTSPECCWVANMYVLEAYRRRGIARALMTAMVEDDARYGVTHSVLLSSSAGSKLYPVVGYEQIGLLQIFAPNKDIWKLR